MHKKTQLKERDNSLDIARAMCVLYIVGFWHVEYYMPKGTFVGTETNEVLSTITMSVLGVFTFISGYFLKKYTFHNCNEVRIFYINRFKRFYILFAISLITLYFTGGHKWIQSINVLILSLLGGLSIIFPPAPSTLWYFCMLIIFYLCTPILMFPQGIRNKLITSLAVISLFIIISLSTGTSKLFLFYLIIYIIGLNFQNEYYFFIKKSKLTIFLISLTIFVVLYNYYYISHSIIKIVNSLTFIITILTISQILSDFKNYTFINVYTFIGYSSMAAYLFHRQIYDVTYYLFNLVNIALTPIIMYLIVVPSVFVFGYYIQKIYDSIIESNPKSKKIK